MVSEVEPGIGYPPMNTLQPTFLKKVSRRALVILPTTGNARSGTGTLVDFQALHGYEKIELSYDSTDASVLQNVILTCGIIINGIQKVDLQLWTAFREARKIGILVLNYDRPGLYLHQKKYIDLAAAIPKYLAPYSAHLEKTCETRDDGYREVLIHVISGPGMEAERLVLRDKVCPALVDLCRTRRLRPVYADTLESCGVASAMRSAEKARLRSIHIVLISGKREPEEREHEYLCRFVDKIQNRNEQEKFNWIRRAPQHYNRFEFVISQVLQLAEEPAWNASSGATTDLREVNCVSPQHVLAYLRDSHFMQQLPDDVRKEYYSVSTLERRRVGAMLSVLYAHPYVAIRQFQADYAPSADSKTMRRFICGVPRHTTNLGRFASDVLDDIWSRITHEFPLSPSEFTLKEHEPEFSLQQQLPFYFNRGIYEYTLMRCIKLGRPNAVFVGGEEGSGVTSILQRCARKCRQLYCSSDKVEQHEVVILSLFPGLGRAYYNPTQVHRLLATSLLRYCGNKYNVPGRFNESRAWLFSLLRQMVNKNHRVLIFIDAATALENPRGISWLFSETELPSGVQMIVGGDVLNSKVEQNTNTIHKVLPSSYDISTFAAQKTLRRQLVGLYACIPKAMSKMLLLGPMEYIEIRSYVTKYLIVAANIELEDALLNMLLGLPGLASISYAKLLVEEISSMNMDDTRTIFEYLVKLTTQKVDIISSRLDRMELIFPRSMLALILPTVAYGCNSLTLEGIMSVIATTLDWDEQVYLGSFIAPTLMWEARGLILGPIEGTFKISSDATAGVIIDRYAPNEPKKRAIFRLLSKYYGSLYNGSSKIQKRYTENRGNDVQFSLAVSAQSTGTQRKRFFGNEPLFRSTNLSSNALERDADAPLKLPATHQERHLVVDAINLLPYYLTQARQFGELCTLLQDFSFIQAKLKLGEVSALLDDFDRVLQFSRLAWLEDDFSDDCSPKSVEYASCKQNVESALREKCIGHHPEDFRRWVLTIHEHESPLQKKILAYRDLIFRNMSALHFRPFSILQVALNAPGGAAPGIHAEREVRRRSLWLGEKYSKFYSQADSILPGVNIEHTEHLLLLWGNRPQEAPVMELRDHAVHKSAVTTCAWLDETAFVTGDDDGLLAIWSTNTGECVARLIGHSKGITSLVPANIFKQDQRIISGSKDFTIRLWKIKGDLGQTNQVLTGHTDHVTALAFSQFACQLFTIGRDHSLIVWDLKLPLAVKLHCVNTLHLGHITSLACSPKATSFVTGSSNKTAQIWTVNTRSKTESKERYLPNQAAAAEQLGTPELSIRLCGHLAEVTCCAFGPHDTHLATGSLDHSILLWNSLSGAHMNILVGHNAAVIDICYDSSGKILLSLAKDLCIRIWRPLSGETVLVLKQCCAMQSARFSPDASRLLVVGGHGTIVLWNWVGRIGSASVGHVPQKPALFSEGFKLRVDLDRDEITEKCRTRSLLNSSELEEIVSCAVPRAFDGQIHEGTVTTILGLQSSEFSDQPKLSQNLSQSSFFLSGGQDGLIRRCSLENSDVKIKMTFKGHSKAIRALTTSRELSATVSASEDGSLVLWDTARGQGLNVLTGHKGPVLACCFIDGHPSVISGGKDQRIRVWDVSEPAGGIMKAELSGHEGQITGLAPLGEVKTMIASCSTDKTWRIWDINRKEATRSLSGHTSGLTSLAITPCMDITLTTSLDFTARIWDFRESRGEIHKFDLPLVPVASSASPYQDSLLCICAGDGLHMYDNRMWKEVAFFQGLANFGCVSFGAPGRIYCGDDAGRIYSLDTCNAPALGNDLLH
eukprot:31479-Pelagococcus_subviridis.AAC.37